MGETKFRKASRCASASCVEVDAEPGASFARVRDSKLVDSPVLTFGAGAWTAAIATIKAGGW